MLLSLLGNRYQQCQKLEQIREVKVNLGLARNHAVDAQQVMEKDHVMTPDMLGRLRGRKTGETACLEKW